MFFKKDYKEFEMDYELLSEGKEQDFQTIVNIVKNYPKAEFKKLLKGVELAWEGYDTALRAKTREEKEIAETDKVESVLEEMGGDNGLDK